MSLQIEKKWLGEEAVDGSKIKLLEGQALIAEGQSGDVDLIKLNESGDAVVPQGIVASEAFVASEVAAEADLRIAGDASTLESAEMYTDAEVNSEKNLREAADLVLQGNIDAEVLARQGGDIILQGNLDAEILTRENADIALSGRLDSLELDSVTQAYVDAADVALDGKIETEKGRIDAILSASDADKDSFAEIVQLINSVDTENDSAFAGYVLSNNEAIANIEADIVSVENAIASEESARIAEDLLFVKLDGTRSMTGTLNMGGGAPTQRTRVATLFPVTAGVESLGANISYLLDNGFNSATETFKIQKQVGIFNAPGSTTTDIAIWSEGAWSFVNEEEISVSATPSFTGTVPFTTTFTGTVNFSVTETVSGNLKIINLANGTSSTDAANYGQVQSVISFATNIQNELNTTQSGAGLSTTGSYVAHMESSFLGSALSLHNADLVLDGAIQTEINDRMAANDVLTQSILDEQSRAEVAENSLSDRLVTIESKMVIEDAMFEVGVNGVSTEYIELAHLADKIYKVCVGRLNVFKDVDYTLSVTEPGMTKITWIGELASGGLSPMSSGDKIFVTYITF
jgi:hypothetical protein